jgi:RNA polymerase sigma-70 factor (ECF subfamily)
MEVDPDRRIAAEVIAGNHQAYNQLIERYWARIFSRVYSLLGNREDAEEVTQDAFTRALENLGSFRWEASFSTWLYQIASNLARNRFWYWKRRGRDRSMSIDMPLTDDGYSLHEILPDNEADPGDRLRWEEFHGAINQHLERLPDSHREVMEMRLLDELSYEEISAELEIPVGTVKSRIARARTHLTRSLGLKKDANVHVFAQELVRGRH